MSKQNPRAVHSELELRVNNVKEEDPNVTLLHAGFLLQVFVQMPFGHHVQDRPFDTRSHLIETSFDPGNRVSAVRLLKNWGDSATGTSEDESAR